MGVTAPPVPTARGGAPITRSGCPGCGRLARPGTSYCAACGRALTFVYRPLRPGQRVRNYTVARVLSKGGMGVVYLAADHAAFDRTVVIKELLDYFDPADPNAVRAAQDRFRDEARTLAALRHPGIPQIYTFFSHDVSNYMVLEYIAGRDLEHGLKTASQQPSGNGGDAYPEADVVRWGIGLCKVLEYLAGRRPAPVVHHDIKPANLVLDADSGEVRLVDFGTARARLLAQPGGGVGRHKSSIYGTVGYAPPEQYQGVSEPRSDVYALAATLYHLLTNEDPRVNPFHFPRLPDLPAGLRAALEPALELNVARRCSANELRRALEAVAPAPGSGLPVPAVRASAVGRLDQAPMEACAKLVGHTGVVQALAWSPDGQVLASAAADRTVRLWAANGQARRTLAGHATEVLSIAWHPRGSLLASGAADGTICLWQVDGRLVGALGLEPTAIAGLAWHPSGAPLASGSADHLVHLWQRDPALPGALAGHGDRVLALAWSPDGSVLASGGAGGATRLWHKQSGRQQELCGHTQAVRALAWRPDGSALASASDDGTIQLWSPDGARYRMLRGHAGALAVAWSPDGATLASGGSDNVVTLWSGDGLSRGQLAGHAGAVQALAWSPAGNTLASGSADTTIRLWRPPAAVSGQPATP